MMLRIALFSLIYRLVLSIEKPFYNVEHASYYFDDFVVTYNKSYSSIAERQERLKIFTENMIKVNKMNEKESAVYEINKFADLTVEEFLISYTGRKNTSMIVESSCNEVTEADIIGTNFVPATWDWRDQNVVTPVKDQKQCGCDYAFSTVGNIESQYAMNNNGEQLDLSEQQLVDCTKINYGCMSGFSELSMMDVLRFGGLESEADYKYRAMKDRCHFQKSLVKIQISGCMVYKLKDEDKLKEVLYKNGPVSIGFSGKELAFYSGGIVKTCSGDLIDASALLVGYGSENGDDFWTIKNSWGKDYGEQGYIRILRGQNMCGLMNVGFLTAIL